MKFNKSILPHLVGLLLTLTLTLSLITYNLFSLPHNTPIPKSFFLHPQTWLKILTFKKTSPIICHPAKPIFLSQYQTTTYSSNYTIIAFPHCNESCSINFLDLNTNKLTSIPAPNPTDPGNPATDVNQLFFDQTNGIISYTTGSSQPETRVIINWQGKLLHTIDETPGTNYQLQFLYYQPQSDMLVYQDNFGNQYHYSANSIALYKNPCP
jgi:hypothetical protein